MAKFMSLFFLVTGLLSCCLHTRVEPQVAVPEPVASDLRAQLVPTQSEFRLGEVIRLRIELTNVGTDTIYVGNEIPTYDWLYALNLSVFDKEGKSSEQIYFFHPQIAGSDGETDFTRLTRHWLAIPPGYFFGRTVEIDPALFEKLQKPGEYTIQGVYSSLGMIGNASPNSINDSGFVESLPYKVWTGKVKTNPTTVLITSRK